jgi:DUF4097 and DUF4098 domain-containing protein YvlB
MSRIFPWLSTGLLGSLVLLAGCGKQVEHTSTEVLERTYEIDSTARLKIRNLRGSISIHGSDIQEVKLRATKKAPGAAQLQDINVSVAAESGSVSIATTVLPQKKRSPAGGAGTVDYDLVVPRTINIARLELEDGNVLIEGMEDEEVRANVVDGQVTIRKCCANLHVVVANGDLDLSLKDCGQHSFLTDAQLTHGKAKILLQRDASIHVRAQTERGTVSNDFAEMVEVNGASTRKVDLSLGSNARSQLTVRVTTGDIRIASLKSDPGTASDTASNAASR